MSLLRLRTGVVASYSKEGIQLIDLTTPERRVHKLSLDLTQVIEQMVQGEDVLDEDVGELLNQGLVVSQEDREEHKYDSVVCDLLRELTSLCRKEISDNEQEYQAMLESVLKAHSSRRWYDFSLGQCPVLPSVVVARIQHALEFKEYPSEIKALCLGDDDFLCAGLNLRSNIGVTVLDADPNLLEIVSCINDDLVTRYYDFRTPPPEELFETQDLVFTDPMPTPTFLELVLARARSFLKPGGVLGIAVNPLIRREFVRLSEKYRFAIHETHYRLNQYYTQELVVHPYESDYVICQKDSMAMGQCQSYFDFDGELELFDRELPISHQTVFRVTWSNLHSLRDLSGTYMDLLIDYLKENREEQIVEVDRLICGGAQITSLRVGLGTLLQVCSDPSRLRLEFRLFPFLPELGHRLVEIGCNLMASGEYHVDKFTGSSEWSLDFCKKSEDGKRRI